MPTYRVKHAIILKGEAFPPTVETVGFNANYFMMDSYNYNMMDRYLAEHREKPDDITAEQMVALLEEIAMYKAMGGLQEVPSWVYIEIYAVIYAAYGRIGFQEGKQ